MRVKIVGSIRVRVVLGMASARRRRQWGLRRLASRWGRSDDRYANSLMGFSGCWAHLLDGGYPMEAVWRAYTQIAGNPNPRPIAQRPTAIRVFLAAHESM